MAPRPVTIVGGGIAGLALGIFLREKGVPARIIEAGNYPRHRVCGEFICGRGVAILRERGLHAAILRAGGLEGRTVGLFSNGVPARRWSPPSPALCVSRYRLDSLLAELFVQHGGELSTGTRWQGSFTEPGVVRAAGRRPAPRGKWRWIGIKAHARVREPSADLEMHFHRHGYAGAVRLPDGRANICALVRSRKPLRELCQNWRPLLDGMIGGRALDWDETSFSSVAALSFTPPETEPDVCAIGDSWGMIAPLTGNGMSIAIESAELAAIPICEYSRGKIPWSQARARVAAACRSRFANRLRWARAVQNLAFTSLGQTALRLLVAHGQGALPFLFARTH